MIPARGMVLVRPATTEETIPGGKIILPQNTREQFAAYQVEVLAVGLPEICEDPDECERPEHEIIGNVERPVSLWHHPIHPALVPGAWCVVKHRSFVPSDDPLGQTYFVHQNDILAVLRVT